jgi:hypothetical protein
MGSSRDCCAGTGTLQRKGAGASAHLVESADHAALEDRPEALKRVRAHGGDNVAAIGVLEDLVQLVQPPFSLR